MLRLGRWVRLVLIVSWGAMMDLARAGWVPSLGLWVYWFVAFGSSLDLLCFGFGLGC